jgi:protocatechuate 3,4-dioxygenase beta subunit
MRMKLGGILVCFLALAASALTQTNASEAKAPAKATLQGRVVKEPSGEPLKKAIIEVIAENQELGGNYNATSDQEGHFTIADIQPGRYRIFVERTGFQEVDEKNRRLEGLVISLDAGQDLKDQTLHMLAAAALTGRVLDEDGDPMSNVEVSVLRHKSNTFEAVGSAHTNDLGEYRVGGLLPGKYIAVASPMPNFQSLVLPQKSGEQPDRSSPAPMYGPTYYPGAADRAQATPIELRPGEDMPADFSLSRRQAVRLRGKVIGLRPDARADIALRSKDALPVFIGSEVGKDGKFEMLNIAPGSYILSAVAVTAEVPLSAQQKIEVGSADIDDLQLTLMPPATLRGRVRFDDRFPKSEKSETTVSLRPSGEDEDSLVGVTINDDTPAAFRGFAKLKADGSFEIKNVPSGVYEVNISGDTKVFNEAYVESLTAGTKDYVDTGLNVNGGTVTVDVAVSSQPGVIEGTVTTEKGELVNDAVVVAVPEARFRKQLSRYQRVSADQAGKFTIRGLRPGSYTLFAWEHLEDDEYRDADFVKPYEGRGVEVKVEKSGHQTVPLKVIYAPADQP